MKKALMATTVAVALAVVVMTTSGSGTAAGQGPPTVAAVNGHFTFNGVPTFLVMARAFSACPNQQVVNADASLGVFILDHYHLPCEGVQDPPNWASMLESTLGDQMYWLERQPEAAQVLDGMPQLVNWEGDTALDANPAAQLSCKSGSSTSLFNSINAAAKHGPVIYEVFLVDSCLTGQLTSQILATAAYAGASGVYLITQRATAPDEMVGMPPEVRDAAQQTLGGIKPLEAALLSPRVAVKNHGAVKVTAHKYNGRTYYFAVNTGNSASRCTIAAKGKKARVWGEHRALRIVGGKFSDNRCAGGSHHVYVVP